MNLDATMSLLRQVMMFAAAYATGKGWLTPADAGALTTFLTTVGPVLIPAAWSVYSHWGMVKAPDTDVTKAAIARQASAVFVFFVLFAALAVGGIANAADLPRTVLKAPTAAAVSPYEGLNGLFIGAGVSGSGTSFDVLGSGLSGSLNANGTVIDLHASYKYYDGARYAAFTAGCGYDMTMNAGAAGGVPSDHLLCTELVDLGGWLGSVVNISQNPVLPDFLKGAIPFVTVGAAQRLSKTGRAAGAGAVLPVMNAPNWVVGARYLNIDYSSAQVSPIDVMKTENYVGIFVERKFGASGTGFLGFGN